MKAKFLLTALLSFVFYLLSSQIPQGFNYQAIARNGTGDPIINALLPVRITIQSDSIGGTTYWIEEHSTVTTNSYGLFSLILGKGVRKTGSTAATFNDIDWTVTPKFIKTEIFSGIWKNMGSSRLWAVPYSMVAGELEGSVNKLSVVGEDVLSDEALFEVKRKDGETMFAVYNHGVRVYMPLDTNSKARKGGFAVGGFTKTKGTTTFQDYFVVNPDSIRAYIDTNSVKSRKGGFAVGGFNRAKTGNPNEEYLRVTRDSTRIYVRESAKGVKGGFAVGGFSATKGMESTDPFTALTPDNYLIGHRSGKAMTTGKYNSFLGYETGISNATGGYNTILGYQSGYKNNADFNVFLGFQSGYNNVSGISNTFLGHLAGFQNSNGNNNVFLGDSAGYNNLAGNQNIFLGNGSGKLNNADYNAFIGYQAGYKNLSGSYNSFIGYQAGYKNETGSHNAFIGYMSGFWTWKGSKNIFIGYKAGYYNYGTVNATGQPGNNNIYIGESAGTNNISGNANVYIGLEAGLGNSPDYSSPPRYNVYIGYQAGYKEYKGGWNTFIGYQAGYFNNLGNWSTFIGYQAGYNHLTGNYNTFIGYQAGVGHQNGGNNTMIGNYSGYKNASGIGNVFIGFEAGYYTVLSNRLLISNTKTDSLIYGEFDNKVVRINNKLGIGITPTGVTQALEVSGSGRFTSLASTANHAVYADANGILTNTASDINLKENISTIDDALAKVLRLRGVTYSWKNDPAHARNIGFIAQEVEDVLPELVFTTPSTGMKGVDYAEITAVLAESVKDQQAIIRNQEEQINSMKIQNEENKKRILMLEQTVQEIKSLQEQNNKMKNR